MAAEFPSTLPSGIEIKSTLRDTAVNPEEFWNGRDANQVRDEVIAIARNLGPFGKFEPTFLDDEIFVASGTSFLGTTKLEFDGGQKTLAGSAFVWVDENGDIQSGPSFPSDPHVPVCEAIFSGVVIGEVVDERVMVDSSGGFTASGTGYTPTTPGDWDPVPTTVGEGLDILASGLENICADADGEDICYDPGDPGDWSPTPSGVGEALDQLGDRMDVLESASGIVAHADTHVKGGADVIDGDKIDVTYDPDLYTPTPSGSTWDDEDCLAGHLDGINEQLKADHEIGGHFHYAQGSADPSSPTPTEGDRYWNEVLHQEMRYDASRGKFLSVESVTIQFGRNGFVAPGSFYKGVDGLAMASGTGFPAFHSGTVVGIGYTRDDTDSATFQVLADGVSIAELLASGVLNEVDVSLDGDFDPGEVLSVKNKSGGSTTKDVQGWVKLRWRG